MEINPSSLFNLVKSPPPPPPPPPAPDVAPPPTAASATVPAAQAPGAMPEPNATVEQAVSFGAGLVETVGADLQAVRQLFANQDLQEKALATASAEQVQGYGRIAAALDDAPRAHLGAQLDLLQGKLGDNPLYRGLADAHTGLSAKAFVGSDALAWLKGKVDDAENYVEKRLGLDWDEKPVTKDAPTDQQVADAAAADPARQAKVDAAVAALSPEDRQRYDQVSQALGDQPGAKARLEDLLTAGKLTGDKDLSGGKSLLENLAGMATQPLAPELADKRGQLLADTVREIHDPTTVDQKQRNTCGAATIQSYMAAAHPAEYARLVAGLASPAGEVKMQDGGTLTRDPNFMDASDSGRSLSGRLIEPPLMSKAGLGTYDNHKDGTVIPIPGLDLSIPGMIPEGMAHVLTELTGENHEASWITPGFANHAYEDGTPTKPVPVLVNYPDTPGEVAPHWISVTGVDKDKGTVTFRNPWGREETVSQAEFDRHVYAVVGPAPAQNPFLA